MCYSVCGVFVQIQNIFKKGTPANIDVIHVLIMECLEAIPEHYKRHVTLDSIIFTDCNIKEFKEHPLFKTFDAKGNHIVIYEFRSNVDSDTVRYNFIREYAQLFLEQNGNMDSVLVEQSKSLPIEVVNECYTASDLFAYCLAAQVTLLGQGGMSPKVRSFFERVNFMVKTGHLSMA